jgi:hypothetical protein
MQILSFVCADFATDYVQIQLTFMIDKTKAMKKIIVFIFSAIAQLAVAQSVVSLKSTLDPLFPGKGKFNGGLLTTYSGEAPPPVLIGDITYGVSNKFSVGITGGTTGALALFGIKVNASLLQRENFKVVFRMVSVYYPERDGKFLFEREDKYVMPWMLSMGFIDAEWKTKKNIRWALGIGVSETHCIEDMKMWFRCEEKHHTDGDCEEMKPSLIQVYGTVQGSVSIPLSKRLILRPEVIAVFKDSGLIKRGEYKITFPINSYIGIVYKF